MITRISEFQAGNETMKNVSYTVYYDSGRKVNYTGRDTLPLTVVTFLTAETTVSETVYINDDYNNCVNKRTVYTTTTNEEEAETMTRKELYTAITAAGVALHPCNAADTAPADDTAIYYLTIEELTGLYADITDTDTEEEEEEQNMKPENKLYLSNWDYNAALIIEELAAIVENNGGTVKPGTVTIIENRALNENMRTAASRLEQLERIEAENPGTNEKRTEAMKRLRADIEKWERIDNSPRTVHHCTWSSAYISFKLGGMYYYYQTDNNPFFDFHYQKTPIDVNGTVSRCACLESDTTEWLWDCFLRADATDADRREAANLI